MGFYGDLLKILAHTGLQTGGNIATQMIAGPMIAEREGQQKLLATLLPTMTSPTATEEQRGAVAKTIEGITKTPWPVAPATNPAGTEVLSSEGAKLTAPLSMDLKSLAPGVSTVSGLVRPPGTLEGMKVAEAQGMTPEQRRTALFPAEDKMGIAWMSLQEKLAATKDEKEKDRLHREYLSELQRGTQTQIAQMTEAGRQDQRNFMKMYLGDKLAATQDENARKAIQGDLARLTAIEDKILIAPEKDKKTLKAQANQLIDQSKHLSGYPKWEEEQVTGGVNIPIIGNIGGTKKTVPVGTKVATPTAPTLAEQAAAELERRRKAGVK